MCHSVELNRHAAAENVKKLAGSASIVGLYGSRTGMYARTDEREETSDANDQMGGNEDKALYDEGTKEGKMGRTYMVM